MLVKGSDILNKILEGNLSSSTISSLDLSSYLDTSGNALWDNLSINGVAAYNLTEIMLRYPSSPLSQTDVSFWNYTIADFMNFGRSTTNLGNCDFVLGSGDTPETYEDYRVESEILLGLAGKSHFLNSEGNLVLSKTYQNTSEDAVTIREVGFIYIVSSSSTRGDNYQRAVLCSREVLQTPITLESGETVTVSLINNNKIGLTR